MKKKGGAKKKVAKKVVKRPVPQPMRTAMAIVPISEISKPEMYRGKMSLIPTRFTPTQLSAIVAPTPTNIIKRRPGKGGGEWDYVPGWWFKKKANFVFGFMHSFTILKTEVIGDFITVTGRVTIRDPKTGNVLIEKDDFGGAAIKYLKSSKTPLDIGNDFKAAQTDAFKRCMVQFGFAMDVYGKGESVDAGIVVTEAPQPPVKKAVASNEVTVEPIGEPEHACSNCGDPIMKAESDYSKKMFRNRAFCRQCQQLAKKGGPLA